uniref:Uncharacterized protein n=1 Tax=Panagrolaimus superbus TaxID=310955 RepID=A0A914YLP9_9BILA
MTATDGGSLEPKILQRIDLPKEAHRFAVTLFIDEEGFASYKIEPKILDEISCIPEALNKTSLQIPFISFFDSSTVICAYKEGKGYQFLDSWGGKFI